METYTSYRSRTGQTSLTIDFSVKGGPKDVVATLNKDSSISFPDGNLWKKQGGVVGVYSDGFNPERLRCWAQSTPTPRTLTLYPLDLPKSPYISHEDHPR